LKKVIDPNFHNFNWAPQRGPGRSFEAVPNENFEPMQPQVVDAGGGSALPMMGALGATRSGQMWALKHLHPNGENVTSSAGIPDHTNIPVVTPEYRSNYVIGGAGGPNNDNVDILVVGCMDLAFLYRRYPVGAPPPGDAWIGVYYSSASGTGRAGTLQPAPSSVVTEPVNIAFISGLSSLNYPRARGMYLGVTVTFDAPALRDQGRLVAGQLPLVRNQMFDQAEVATVETPTTFVECSGTFVKLGEIPLDEDELFQATPGAIVHEAREGVYMPLRFNEPVQLYTDSTLVDSYNPATLLGFTREGGIGTVTFRGPDGAGGLVNYGTEGLFNFLTGVILFRGIDAGANLSVKCRLGIEAQVERGTAVAPFQHASPPLDKMAIDTVTYVSQTSPMAYPSSYNDFGKILDVIKSVLGIVKTGAGVAGKLGLPYVGAIESVLGGLGFAPRMRGRRRR
jgi:hypothetical protein